MHLARRSDGLGLACGHTRSRAVLQLWSCPHRTRSQSTRRSWQQYPTALSSHPTVSMRRRAHSACACVEVIKRMAFGCMSGSGSAACRMLHYAVQRDGATGWPMSSCSALSGQSTLLGTHACEGEQACSAAETLSESHLSIRMQPRAWLSQARRCRLLQPLALPAATMQARTAC